MHKESFLQLGTIHFKTDKNMYLQFSLQSDRPLTKPLSSQMSNSCFLDRKTTHGDEICMLEIYAEYVMLKLWGSHLKGMWEQHRSLWGSVTAHWSLHCLSLAAITCPPKQHSSVNITCFTRKQLNLCWSLPLEVCLHGLKNSELDFPCAQSELLTH